MQKLQSPLSLDLMPPLQDKSKTRAVAIFSFSKKKAGQLSLSSGDIVTVLEKKPTGWWVGEVNGERGKFPGIFLVRCLRIRKFC